MTNPFNRLYGGKFVKISVLFSSISILLFIALVAELPGYAQAASVADATATWGDVPTVGNPVATDAAALPIPEPIEVATSTAGKASWYVHPRYRNVLMAASTIYPKGTKVKVTNLKNNKSVIVTIKDYGPDPIRHPDRVIDLNKLAFSRIASIRSGIINVRVELIATSTIAALK